jgi:tripartite-type tricarboxylate transporter receptor subunit TctC
MRKFFPRQFVALFFALFAVCTAGISPSIAETYPSRPVTIVVPYPAGGPTDTIARILAERMGVDQTLEALAAKQKAEIAKWTPIIKESGIKVQ